MRSSRNKTGSVGLVLAAIILWSCAQKEQKVERTTENGVEVVNNHLEPYKISGELAGFIVEEEFTIDTEQKDLINIGLMAIRAFDVDSAGNIYLFQAPKTQAKLVFEFDYRGNFLRSFGQLGQGPGEVQYPSFLGTNSRDEIL
jgi:hypothetical protein